MITFLKKIRKIYFFKVCLNIELSVSNCRKLMHKYRRTLVWKRDMKKNTCIAVKEWFEKKFLIIYGFACLFEITIFKYKIELQNILLVLMNLQKAA